MLAFDIPSSSQRFALGASLSRNAGEGQFDAARPHAANVHTREVPDPAEADRFLA
jgi:hypothetical protein